MDGLLILITDVSKIEQARSLAATFDASAEGRWAPFHPLVPRGTTDPGATATAYWDCWSAVQDDARAAVEDEIATLVSAGAIAADAISTYSWPCDTTAILAAHNLQRPATTR